MIVIACKSLLILQLVASLLVTMQVDIEGRKAKPPAGFAGVLGTLLIITLMSFIYYGAGVFDFS